VQSLTSGAHPPLCSSADSWIARASPTSDLRHSARQRCPPPSCARARSWTTTEGVRSEKVVQGRSSADIHTRSRDLSRDVAPPGGKSTWQEHVASIAGRKVTELKNLPCGRERASRRPSQQAPPAHGRGCGKFRVHKSQKPARLSSCALPASPAARCRQHKHTRRHAVVT
jgi:hypothetical protein